MTDQERYIRKEARMQNLRWATPGGLFVLTSLVVFFGWMGNDYLSQIRTSIIDLKTDGNSRYEKIWSSIASSKNRTDCLQNQLAKCCKDSLYCA